MAQRKRKLGRSATEWTIRGILALAVLGIGWIGVAQTLDYARRTTQLGRAYLAEVNQSRVERARADRLAREALRNDPTAVSAVFTLGINTLIGGDEVGARRLFAYSERLSRRDLQTQLWFIEDSVGRGDIKSALRHYDTALRTSRNSPEVLFPILASAIAEPQVRTELAATLASKPNWGPNFIAHVAANGQDPQATASLFIALRRRGLVVPVGAQAGLIATLVARNLFEPAWAYYSIGRRDVDRRQSRDPSFISDPAVASPFDWNPINDGGTSVSIQRVDEGGVVDFSAPASVGGPLLRQLQVLPPGNYRIRGVTTGIDQASDATPYWTLICANGRALDRVVLPNSAKFSGAFAGKFSVPADCPSQTLTLIARPSSAVSGLSGQINHVQLTPVR